MSFESSYGEWLREDVGDHGSRRTVCDRDSVFGYFLGDEVVPNIDMLSSCFVASVLCQEDCPLVVLE